MPRKTRELKADLQRAGFEWRPGKGSHGKWIHPLLPEVRVILSGADGEDARDYQERDVRRALTRLRAAEERRR